ncbi:signal peptide peptidase-domain-containing protein [Aspergillus filifer]
MAEVSPLAELLGQALYQFEQIRPLLPTYGHVIVSALFPLYIGAHASLSRPSSAAKPSKGSDEEAHDDSDDEEEEEENYGADQKMEGLAPNDALVFPLTAGATLGGLYLVIEYAGADLLNKILGFYFSQMGMFFAMSFIKDAVSVVRSFVFPRKYTRGGRTWKLKPSERIFSVVSVPTTKERAGVRHSPLPGFLGSIPLPRFVVNALWAFRTVLYWRAKLRIYIHRVVHLECPLGALDILSILLSLPAVSYFTFYSKPWWLTNFLGFSFCYGTLQLMSPSTFVTGSLILGSLFFYDIYFVYFTPLMVTVAKNLDVPIKLLFPRPPAPSEAPDAVSLAMLGLGDIIVPGMMVGLALRFDLYLYYKLKGTLEARAKGGDTGFVKPVYQTATGGWGERFWAPSARPSETELKPPYSDARSFPKTYFKASIVGYTVGMVTTLVVMQIFDHPQPALLYLVPGVLISLWGTALVKGQIRDMWEFSDAEDEEEATEKKNDDGKIDKDQAPASQKARGLFARVFSGEGDAKSQNKDKDSKKEAGKEENKKSEVKDGHAKDSKDTDLFSISIYMPRKATTEKSPADKDASGSTPDEEENWSYAGAAKQDNEPPAKRRRRSPRHAPATSQ